jgi:ADP-heptose:LPS heptosyltransferase
MHKYILNFLMRSAVRIYIRLGSTKIERIDEHWTPPARWESILVFSNTALGDTLLSTPAITSLRQSFPNVSLTLFVHRDMAPLFEGLAHVDHIVRYHGGFHKFVRTVMALRKSRPQAALLLHSNSPQDIPMAVLSGARIILKTPTQSEYRQFLSHQFMPKLQHVIEERLDLVRLLGAKQLITRMQLPRRYDERRPDFLPKSIGGAHPVIGFQLGAANTFKMWPAENFAVLADRLTEKLKDAVIVITGSRNEHLHARRTIDLCTTRRIHNLCGQYGIQDLPYLLREFDLLVTNDTGTMHLAVALGVPTLCLFGPTSATMIGPYQDLDRHRVIQKAGESVAEIPKKKRTNETMRLITVDEVFNAVLGMLRQRAIRRP